MVAVAVPVLYGNVLGGYSLHDPTRKVGDADWAARIPDQVSLVNGSGAWVFLAVEMHEEVGNGLPQGGHRYFLSALKAADLDWALLEGDQGNHCYYRPSKITAVSRTPHNYQVGRSYSDFVLRENTSAFAFHAVLTHLFANDSKGKSRTPQRKAQGRELAKFAARLGYAFVAGDFNSSTEAEGYPRDSMEDVGFRGLRQRGAVSNGTTSTRATEPAAKTYWIDEIWTRPAQAVSGSALVLVNGASDHNWLKTTITWDTAVAPAPAPSFPAFAPPPSHTDNPWTATVRDRDFTLLEDVRFQTGTLVENYNQPDMLSITGRWSALEAAVSPGFGLRLTDDLGSLRFSGHLVDIDRQGAKNFSLIYASDLVRLWWRICWPVPSAAWSKAGQNLAYDIQAGSVEARLLAYVNRNTGPGARTERRETLLRLPASQNRGSSATTSARFNVLGELAAALAEAASLRMRVAHTFTGWTPHLDLTLEDTLDLSDVVQFSPPDKGGTYQLAQDWRYRLAIPTVNVALSAAGGVGADRILTMLEDQDSQDMWGARVEGLVDQRDTTDATEISDGLVQALAAGAGPTEFSLPIGRAPGLGTVVPLGAKVSADTDDQVTVERVRQITTSIGRQTGQSTRSVTGTIGSPDGIQSPSQRRLALALAAAKKGQRI